MVLPTKDKVSAIIYVEKFIIKLANQVISQVLNCLIKGTRDVEPPPRPIYLAHELTRYGSILLELLSKLCFRIFYIKLKNNFFLSTNLIWEI